MGRPKKEPTSLRTQEMVRKRISAIKHVDFLNRLSLEGTVIAASVVDGNQAKGYTTNWEPAKMALRAKVSMALLDKVLPNLQSIAHTDPNGDPLRVIFTSADASVL